ncbi:eukaryotic translation initiation factor 4G [Cryptomeria japonica]|uniref:eukaryotic translation initiation factor 4G n=1 Tax=Cryptomeria japonica TaxID=3369 RepID=UPI0025ABEAC0|nr:eukaryotic translation initiation factor 4G [Cryptomeria japonica]
MFLGQEETRGDYAEQGGRREKRTDTTGEGEVRGITGGGAAAAPFYNTNACAIKPSRGGEQPIESSNGYHGPYINCENQIEITSQSLHELAVSSGIFKLPSSPSAMQPNAFGLGSIGVSPKPAFSKIPSQISQAGSPMLIGGTSQEVYGDAIEPPFAFQFGSISPAFANGMQNPLQESQVQGRRYLHANGLPFPSPNHCLIARAGNPVQFQQTQTQSVPVQMQYSVPTSQAQLSGGTLEPLSSLQPTALHSQQAMMLQGQCFRLQQPMLLHTSHGVPQHLNPIPFRLPMQQLSQIAHPVSSRAIVSIGSKQPSQIPGTQSGPPVEDHCINPHLNRAIKITHPVTHEELRFDSKCKKSESYMDTCMLSFPGSPIMPQRTAANQSPQLCPPVDFQTQNFYSAQERSYRHALPTFYQRPKTSLPMGSLRVPEQNTAFSAWSTQPLAPRASIGTPRISVLPGHAVPIYLATDNERVQSVVSLPAEKHIITSSSFIQVDDTYLPNSTSVTCSGELDSSEILSPGNCWSSATQSGLLSSLASETSTLSYDRTRSVVDSATCGIKQSIPCTSVSIKLTPDVDMASSDASVPEPTGGPKISNHGLQKGESVKASSPTTVEHSNKRNKKKIQQKSFSASKFDDPKEALVNSSSVISSHSFVNNLSGDGRSFVLQESGNLNEVELFNAEEFSADRTTVTAGHVNVCRVSDDKVVNEIIEHPRPMDVAQITETNINLDASTRNFKMEKTAEMVNLDNSSVNSIISDNDVLLVGNHVVDAYESQNNGITKFDSTSAAVSLHGNSHIITKSRAVFNSNTFLQKSPPTAEKKTEESFPSVVSSEIPDGSNRKQIGSDVSMSQEHSLEAVDEQSTLQEPCTKENENIIGTTIQFKQGDSSQVKEVAVHDMKTHCEFGHESGEAMLMHEVSFVTESEMKKVSEGARKRASVNLKDKPVGLTPSAKEKVESVSVISNSQASLGSRMKHNSSKKKKKKKKKKYLARADASSSTGDLYDLSNAYKAPEEKNDDVSCLNTSNFARLSVKGKHSVRSAKKIQIKLDDSERLAELPTENNLMENRLINFTKTVQVDVPKARSLEYRKYTRDFLLTFMDQFRNLPSHYEIQPDLAEHLFKFSRFFSHSYETHTSVNIGRAFDCPLNSGDQSEHLISNLGSDNRRIRSGGYVSSGHDIQKVAGPEWPADGFRPGCGLNPGLKRNVHGAAVNPSIPASIPGDPLRQMSVPLGDSRRNTCDANRWKHCKHSSVSFQKGFFPTWNNLPAIHKANNKYEIGKVSDEENSKQRQIKAILNKLTPQNFDKLFYKVKEVNIDSAFTLTGVISQIFDKAVMEPTFCEMYAKFCIHLAAELPEFYENNEQITFKRVLLNRCQEEFQSGEREWEEADKIEEDVEVELSNESREYKRIKARRRMLGNIRFIGELYKISMLSERIMHECIKKLLGEHENPDEEDVEALCKLMSTIGHMIDQSKAREHIDVYFEIMTRLCNNPELPSRLRFMLKDVIDLRKNGWQQRRRVEGPKKIEEVHRDAVQQRQAHSVRSKRGHASGSSGRRIPTLNDYASWKSTSMEFSSCQPIGSVQKIREAQLHRGIHAYGRQDVRLESKLVSERKSIHKKSRHRPSEVPLTLGPQGGLTRGVINRKQPVLLVQNDAADARQVFPMDNKQANLRQMIGQSNIIDCEGLAARGEYMLKTVSVAITPNSFEQSLMPSVQERNSITPLSKNSRKQECSVGNSEVIENNGNQLQDSLDKIPMAKHSLREKSDLAIKEYYSVRDMDEAALCVNDLKSAWFHSDMVSQWVIDSFDRKDVERDLLSKLLVHLHKRKPAILNREQLIRGLAISLSSLEDRIIDAPRAPDFFGGILGKMVVAEILSFAECTRIIKEGGIEPGNLLKVGLALDMVTSVLNIVKRERGKAAMTDMYKASELRLKDFMPCDKNQHYLESLLKKKNLQCMFSKHWKASVVK